MQPIFIGPKFITKIQAKVDQLAVRWGYERDELHTLWQMVATIESGQATKTFYDKDGIIVDGWNGYRNSDNPNPDPRRAWGGFYRQEPAQMIGWSIYLISRPVIDRTDQIKRCNLAYNLWLEWEDEPRQWGWNGWQDFYTEDEAKEAAQPFINRKVVKRYEIKYSDISGCWRLRVESTQKKANLSNAYKMRILT